MNHTILAGHLGSEPEVRFTSSGKKVTSFRMATNSRRSGKEKTTWWRVTVWGEQCDGIIPHLKKGSAVLVMGELLEPEIYTDREGSPQVSLNLVASQISFSPFGKTERSQQGHMANAPSSHQKGPSAEGGAKPSYGLNAEDHAQFIQPTEMAGSSKESDSPFSDDEIPF